MLATILNTTENFTVDYRPVVIYHMYNTKKDRIN